MAIKAVKTTGTRGGKRVTTLTYKALPKRKTTQRGTCTIETLRQGNVTTVDYLYSPKERKAKRVAKRKPAAKKVVKKKS